MKPIKVYAWFNGIPICKTYLDEECIKEELTTEDAIKEHNQSPITCHGDNCRICAKIEEEKRKKDLKDEYDDD